MACPLPFWANMIVKSQILSRLDFFHKLRCFLFGHSILQAPTSKCECGSWILQKESTTRIRHVLSCFLFGHTYCATIQRSGHNEYACMICGHPLLFECSIDPYVFKPQFLKR